MATGAAWMVLLRLSSRIIGIVSTLILARILVPEDFGLVAIATSIAVGIEMVTEFGFDYGLIRDPKATRTDYDTAWTLTIVRSSTIAVLLVTLALPASYFFNDERIQPIMYVLAATTFMQGFQNIGTVDFRKHLRFNLEFRFTIYQRISGFMSTILSAIIIKNYWALVIGIFASKICGVLLSYSMSQFRPKINISQWKKSINISKWILINNILYFLHGRSDVFILTRMFGTQQIGLYSVSHEIATLPSSELVSPIQRALFPGFANIVNQPEYLRETCIDSFAVVIAIGMPASVGIALLADPAVRLMLGPNWIDAVPLIQILALYGMMRLGSATIGPIMLGIGKFRAYTAIVLLNTTIQLAGLIFGAYILGIIGASLGLLSSATMGLFVSIGTMKYFLDIDLGALFRQTWRTLLSSAIMAAFVNFVTDYINHSGGFLNILVELSAGILIGIITYIVTHFILWSTAKYPHGVEKIFLREITAIRGTNWYIKNCVNKMKTES